MANFAGKNHHKRVKRHTNRSPAPSNSATTAKLILLNKPFGYISQFSNGKPDEQTDANHRTLADLVPVQHVYPAGRLDKDSEGLLLLTDHGPLQHRISHPKMKWLKHYWVQVEGEISATAIQQLTTAVMLKDGPAVAVSAERIDAPDIWPRNPPIRYRPSIPDSWINIVLAEGRNRQVRRMTASVGFPTLRLIRHQIGTWDITSLKSGKYQTNHISAAKLQQLLRT